MPSKSPKELVQEGLALLESYKDTSALKDWQNEIEAETSEVVRRVTGGKFDSLEALGQAVKEAGTKRIGMHFITAAINAGDEDAAQAFLGYNLKVAQKQ